ncbi:hypothetical protein PHLGIDRAFT_128161 [Phlebiopsis gigantea 11061_1 CR5-6]|uniref:Uncharacterized protein n=1 Tax=Phlebiopsis gigantea (strain 11061_1 CR5-6) TaxID=745531 RepID=A0A0C3S7A1_PHLG1|nr:hypothetical protein PHLGIDRAFT_128161 [Phlebiopsis gigantea 11061_1 CR5-6]
MSVYANVTGVLVQLGRRQDTEKSKGRKGLAIASTIILCCVAVVWVGVYVMRFVALRRMGRPLKTCIAIALNTKVPLDHPAPIRVANRDWQVHGTGFKARLARLLPRKLQLANPPPPVVYQPFTVNIQRIGEQYRASPHAPSFPPDGLRPPDPVYRQARSVVDLPSYGEANRDGPPRYDEGPQAERRAEREEGEVTVEHNFVS